MKLYLIAALFLATLVVVPCLAEEEVGNGATANVADVPETAEDKSLQDPIPGEAEQKEDESDEDPPSQAKLEENDEDLPGKFKPDENDEESDDESKVEDVQKRRFPQINYHRCWTLRRHGYCRYPLIKKMCLRVCPRKRLPAQCYHYRVINDITRRQSRHRRELRCDNRIRQGWYRLTGYSGHYIPNRCVHKNRCGTHAAGWVVGNYPRHAGQSVVRQVCFSWAGRCCYNAHWWRMYIHITHCRHYYVFYLKRPRACYYRYCGNA